MLDCRIYYAPLPEAESEKLTRLAPERHIIEKRIQALPQRWGTCTYFQSEEPFITLNHDKSSTA